MNQIALSTVALRLFGVYLVYKLIFQLTLFTISGQVFGIGRDGEERTMTVIGLVLIYLLLKALLAVGLLILAPQISRLLLSEDNNVIAATPIDTTALLSVGLCLLGVYLLTQHLPALFQISLFHLSAEINHLAQPTLSQWQYRGFIEVAILTVFSLLLTFYSRPIARWLSLRKA